jgi:hypothetical protein
VPLHGFIEGTDLFPIQKSPFSASSRKSAALRGGVLVYVAQAIPPIDAEIVEKGHLQTETSSLCTILTFIGTTNPLRAKRQSPDIDMNPGVRAALAIRLVISGVYLFEHTVISVAWD